VTFLLRTVQQVVSDHMVLVLQGIALVVVIMVVTVKPWYLI